jgi:hypothetical protein
MKRIPPDTWQQIKTAFATGSVSLRALARQMNILEEPVLARAKREGWTREIQSAKALVKRSQWTTATRNLTSGYPRTAGA